jgi:acyl-CoA thioester hydrolase
MLPMKHQIRVYWEDTDAGGIVYYANYLKFAERARTEWLRILGFEQQTLREQQQILIVVKRAEVEYLRPARLDDLLTIDTQLQEHTKLRMTMRQNILRGEEKLAEVMVELVCVNLQGKPTPLPAVLLAALNERENKQ